MRTPTVLVTGASGFVGGALVRTLAAGRARVHAHSRRRRLPGSPGARGDAEAIAWHTGDLADERDVAKLLEEARPDAVFHLASLVTGRRDLDLVLPAFQANLAAAVQLLVAATRIGVRRIVLAGSMEEADLAAGEAPSSPYAVAKSAAALYARFAHALYATPVVTARIFMVYGPGQADETKLVPYAIRRALAAEPAKIASGARPVDWIHVDDVARGLVALGEAPGIEGETLDLGSGELVTVGEVATRIARLAGGPPPEIGGLPPRALERPAERAPVADVARTLDRVAFRPEIGLDEGLARTIAAFRSSAGSSGADRS